MHVGQLCRDYRHVCGVIAEARLILPAVEGRDQGILLDSFYCFSVALWNQTPPFADNFSVRREVKRDGWLRP
jgi:hypothetical protein